MPSPRPLVSSFRSKAYTIIILGTGANIAYFYHNHSKDVSKPRHLNPSSFTPYTLISKEAVSSTSAIFTLRPQYDDSKNSAILSKAFQQGIWSVQFKQPQLQIARNYTPLPLPLPLPSPSAPSTTTADGEISVLIRREEGGEVSSYLHDLPERSTVSVRGPFQEIEIPRDVTRILFLAGGTGIAPAMQIAGLLGQRQDVKMSVLWANRRKEDCVGGPKKESATRKGWFSREGTAKKDSSPDEKGKTVKLLETLQAQCPPDHLSVDYFVDEENTFIKPTDVSSILARHTENTSRTANSSSKEGTKAGRSLIFVSGPDGFIDYWAGKKAWANGRETQGLLGGELAKMDRKGWTVIKI